MGECHGLVEDVLPELVFVVPQEGQPLEEQLVGDDAQSVVVDAVVVVEAHEDLGSHVGQGPSVLVGILFLVEGSRPEVSQPGQSLPSHHDVLGLEVPVDDLFAAKVNKSLKQSYDDEF